MISKLNENVEKINFQIQQYTWFYLQIESYHGHSLTIVGSEDFSYYLRLAIVFSDVFFVSAYFESFYVNTEQTVMEILFGEKAEDFRYKFKIPQSYLIFRIYPADFANAIHIAAKNVDLKMTSTQKN